VDTVADILDRNGALDIDEPAEGIDVTPGTETPIRPLTPSPEAAHAVKFTPEESVRRKQRERENRVNIYPGFTGMGPGSTT
jgi:hypothetical protein